MQYFVYNGGMDAKEVKEFLAGLGEEERAILKKLSTKQRIWLETFLKTNNQTEAGRVAKYKSPRQSGQENYINPSIRQIINARIAMAAMDAVELLQHLGKIARGFNATDYIEPKEKYTVDADGIPRLTSFFMVIDLQKLAADGFGDLISSVENTPNGPKYKFTDRKDGLNPLARHLLTNNINLVQEIVFDVISDEAE